MTIGELVQMAKDKGYSMDTVIHPLGADVKYVQFNRCGDGIEYVVLDEDYSSLDGDYEDVTKDTKWKISMPGIAERKFNNPSEIEYLLDNCEGCWCEITNLETLDVILQGAFDDSFLDEEYYK